MVTHVSYKMTKLDCNTKTNPMNNKSQQSQPINITQFMTNK